MAKDLTEALAQLSNNAAGSSSRQDTVLPAVKGKSAIPSRTGTGKPKSGQGGSIAGPLTETAYASRTYWTDKTIASSDGLLALKIKPIKSISFLDANDSPLVMNYKEPV